VIGYVYRELDGLMQAEEPENPEENQQPQGSADNGTGAFSQPFRNQPVAARVPAHLVRGAFTTGLLVQDGPNEFVIDFLQGLSRPPQIAARVVLSPGVMDALVRTLSDNLNKHVQTFGPPAPLPKPQQQRPPNIQEIYENFKLPEELWSGAYANSVLIGHGAAEFFMDFITGFYPTAAVSNRVYFAAQQAPRMLDTLRMSLQQYHRKRSGQQQPPPPTEGSEGAE
jgi:hypothetical protein